MNEKILLEAIEYHELFEEFEMAKKLRRDYQRILSIKEELKNFPGPDLFCLLPKQAV